MRDIRYRLRVHKTIEPTILYFGKGPTESGSIAA